MVTMTITHLDEDFLSNAITTVVELSTYTNFSPQHRRDVEGGGRKIDIGSSIFSSARTYTLTTAETAAAADVAAAVVDDDGEKRKKERKRKKNERGRKGRQNRRAGM